MRVKLKINNNESALDIKAGEMLYDVLRRQGFTSVRKSCGTAACGVCTVLLDGKPIPSCSYLAAKAEGHNITTIEGVREEAAKVSSYITEEGAVQCGFCSPGFILTVISMKEFCISPGEEEIKDYLVGNLCRCSGYQGHLRAVKKYLGVPYERSEQINSQV